MSVELRGEWLVEKAELVMAVRGYENEETRRWEGGIDYVASYGESDDKVLLRVVMEPKSRSGIAGSDVVSEMIDTMKREGYDKGVLISRRFTNSAKDKMRGEGIQMISENVAPKFELDELYVTMQEYIDGLCRTKCGRVPEKQSDCEGKDSKGHYSCKIRLISDNASFHFERGWTNLAQRDFERLIAVHTSMNKDVNS